MNPLIAKCPNTAAAAADYYHGAEAMVSELHDLPGDVLTFDEIHNRLRKLKSHVLQIARLTQEHIDL